jgi:hypothetical protein
MVGFVSRKKDAPMVLPMRSIFFSWDRRTCEIGKLPKKGILGGEFRAK